MDSTSRPISVTMTALGGFILGMWNLWRIAVLLERSHLLLQLGVTLDPRFRLGVALVWVLLFSGLVIALWQRRAAVRWLFPLSLLLYAVYHLFVLPLFMPAPTARQSWLRDVLFYTVAVVWTLWALNRAAIRDYWHDDQRPVLSKTVD